MKIARHSVQVAGHAFPTGPIQILLIAHRAKTKSKPCLIVLRGYMCLHMPGLSTAVDYILKNFGQFLFVFSLLTLFLFRYSQPELHAGLANTKGRKWKPKREPPGEWSRPKTVMSI